MESTSQRGSYHVGEGNTGGVYVAYLKKKKILQEEMRDGQGHAINKKKTQWKPLTHNGAIAGSIVQ